LTVFAKDDEETYKNIKKQQTRKVGLGKRSLTFAMKVERTWEVGC